MSEAIVRLRGGSSRWCWLWRNVQLIAALCKITLKLVCPLESKNTRKEKYPLMCLFHLINQVGDIDRWNVNREIFLSGKLFNWFGHLDIYTEKALFRLFENFCQQVSDSLKSWTFFFSNFTSDVPEGKEMVPHGLVFSLLFTIMSFCWGACNCAIFTNMLVLCLLRWCIRRSALIS